MTGYDSDSPRWLEFLEYIANGLRQHEIASETNYSDATIKRELKNARKQLESETLHHAIAIALDLGLIQVKLDPRKRDALKKRHESSLIDSWKHKLTPRQREIFVLLADNPSNSTLCKILGISTNTLRVHLRGIYKALAIQGDTAEAKRAALVKMAKEVFHVN